MKFGTYLHDNLIPEWESKYLNYSVIKKCIQDTKKLYKQQLQDGEGFPDASLRFNAETLCLELSPAQHIAQEAFQLIENDLNKILEFFSDQCENFVNRTTELGGKVKLFNSSQTRLLEKLKHEAAIARRSSSRSAANFNEAGEILPIAFVKSSSQIMSEKVQKFPRGRRGSAIDLTDLRKHKKNLKTVKKAFIEAYRCWVYLDNYRGLNETAARKIVKKFDKVFGLNIKEMYMSLITREYMFQSKTIIQVMEMMEDVWVTLLSNAPTRHLAMTQLREVHLISIQQQSAFQIFTLGFWMGIIVMLVLVPLMYSIDIEHFSDLSFGAPLVAIRCFGTGTYLTWCWAFDALIWERCRINFGYIFQLPFGIGSVQLFQAAALMSSVFLWFLIVLSTPTNTTVTDMTRHSWTGTFFVVVFVLLVNPFPLFNFRLRKWLLSTVRNCVRAGTVAVRFKDFWLADQFTSIAIIFADIPLLLCYFISNWTGNHDTCASVQYWQRPLFSSIPFWIRYFQCLKKSRDDKNPVQLYNSFKYLASVSVIATAAVHAQVQQIWSQVLWLLCASLSFCFSMYWDTYRDWGFFRHKTNLWPLRSGLKYAEHGLPKQMYFVAIACNAVMRLLWICVASQPELRSKYWWSLVASAIEVWVPPSREHIKKCVIELTFFWGVECSNRCPEEDYGICYV
eukprot:c8864_g1_i1.p1 GENE.c8864_g1_i1~~c8864_g1_i1.p1  ORF type:complete len:678 (+),score=130.69 c8864_g1_i1:37-2070(+)